MGQYPHFFEAFGFTIEVHSGGRRVWPPSFKRYITNKVDSGELTIGEIMTSCQASKSLVYKWRADVRDSKIRSVPLHQERLFSEVRLDEGTAPESDDDEVDDRIHLTGRGSSLSLPKAYPVEDLVRIILAFEGHA